jgi:hypothetical protein
MSQNNAPIGPTQDDGRPNELCCAFCPPNAFVWFDTASTSIFVENSIVETRHLDIKRHLGSHANADVNPTLEIRAATNSSVQLPAGPAQSSDAFAGSKSIDDTSSESGTDFDDEVIKDVEVRKNQGKVYRTDTYTVHWVATGEGRLHVSLRVAGVVPYSADWLPREGQVHLSKTYLLEPPAYDPGGPAVMTATLQVGDCRSTIVTQSNSVPRP